VQAHRPDNEVHFLSYRESQFFVLIRQISVTEQAQLGIFLKLMQTHRYSRFIGPFPTTFHLITPDDMSEYPPVNVFRLFRVMHAARNSMLLLKILAVLGTATALVMAADVHAW